MSEAPDGGYDSRSDEDQRAESSPPAPDGDAYSWYRRGLDLLGRGSAAAAAQLLQRAAEAEPGSRSVLEALGRAQFDAGRYAAAADSFRQIVEASPSDDYAHFGLGLALARREPGGRRRAPRAGGRDAPRPAALHQRGRGRPWLTGGAGRWRADRSGAGHER